MARRRLPNGRECEGLDVEALGLHFHATIGGFDDKAGSMAGILASDSAVLCSIALQYGAPLEVIRRALMRDPQGKASGPLGVVLDKLAAG
jgi:hypothetical protein